MRVGDVVADFEAVDQHGRSVRLSELGAGGSVVLFFYPRAFSTGCTAEACHFRNLRGEFAALSATPVGISTDSVDDQAEFDRTNGLGIPLLSDPKRSIARQFGVRRPGPVFNRRATFVIGPDLRVMAVLESEFNMEMHADEALEILRAQV
jgi:peroxiredoxin Q/BCP